MHLFRFAALVCLVASAQSFVCASTGAAGFDDQQTSSPASAAPVISLGAPPTIDQCFALSASATRSDEIIVVFSLAKGCYLYRDKMRFVSSQATLAAPHWPAGAQLRDANFGTSTVYFDQVAIPIPFRRKNPGAQTLHIDVTFQGCLKDMLCYPPATRSLALPLVGARSVTPAAMQRMLVAF